MADETKPNYELWKQFNLAEQNPAQGGGILYCLSYSKERLEAHQEQVIDVLIGNGARIMERSDRLGIALNEIDDTGKRQALALVEELSVINEALEYHEAGFGACKSIDDLKNNLMARYFDALDKSIVDAYNIAEMGIPQIVRDIRISEAQGHRLKAHERKALEELADFAIRQVEMHNKPQGIVLFGA